MNRVLCKESELDPENELDQEYSELRDSSTES